MSSRAWHKSSMRRELFELYREADTLVRDLACDCAANDTRCCRFAVTGREPYPTAVELEEVAHARRSAGARVPTRARLTRDRTCPLLSEDARCTIYASRPLGCRTFFCHDAPPRAEVQRIARAVAALSERFRPGDPGPRALTRALR